MIETVLSSRVSDVASLAQPGEELLYVTNTPDLAVTEVVLGHKSLADIERSFKMLKSDSEIEPVYHQPPERTQARVYVYFIALVLARAMFASLREIPATET